MTRAAIGVTIVTGGGSGIGAAVARRVARDATHVAILDVGGAKAQAVAEELGPIARAYDVDVTDTSAVNEFVSRTVDEFGGINVVVNSAGVLLNRPFLDTSIEDFERVLRVNLTGSFVVAQRAAKEMVRSGGQIINIASAGGLLGYPGRTAYAASKGGVIAMTRVMAIELAQFNIRVNAVAPGPVPTAMTAAAYGSQYQRGLTSQVPLNRYATPEEIAELVAFLASPLSSYITGQTVAADGGMSISGLTLQALATQRAVSEESAAG